MDTEEIRKELYSLSRAETLVKNPLWTLSEQTKTALETGNPIRIRVYGFADSDRPDSWTRRVDYLIEVSSGEKTAVATLGSTCLKPHSQTLHPIGEATNQTALRLLMDYATLIERNKISVQIDTTLAPTLGFPKNWRQTQENKTINNYLHN